MKNFTSDFIVGIRSWFRSWSFIFNNGLAHYFSYPLIISILLGMGAVVLISNAVDMIMAVITPYFDYSPPQEGGIWKKILTVLADIAQYAVSFLLYIVSFYIFHRI